MKFENNSLFEVKNENETPESSQNVNLIFTCDVPDTSKDISRSCETNNTTRKLPTSNITRDILPCDVTIQWNWYDVAENLPGNISCADFTTTASTATPIDSVTSSSGEPSTPVTNDSTLEADPPEEISGVKDTTTSPTSRVTSKADMSTERSGDNLITILAASVAGCLVIIVASVVAILFCRRKKRQKQNTSNQPHPLVQDYGISGYSETGRTKPSSTTSKADHNIRDSGALPLSQGSRQYEGGIINLNETQRDSLQNESNPNIPIGNGEISIYEDLDLLGEGLVDHPTFGNPTIYTEIVFTPDKEKDGIDSHENKNESRTFSTREDSKKDQSGSARENYSTVQKLNGNSTRADAQQTQSSVGKLLDVVDGSIYSDIEQDKAEEDVNTSTWGCSGALVTSSGLVKPESIRCVYETRDEVNGIQFEPEGQDEAKPKLQPLSAVYEEIDDIRTRNTLATYNTSEQAGGKSREGGENIVDGPSENDYSRLRSARGDNRQDGVTDSFLATYGPASANSLDQHTRRVPETKELAEDGNVYTRLSNGRGGKRGEVRRSILDTSNLTEQPGDLDQGYSGDEARAATPSGISSGLTVRADAKDGAEVHVYELDSVEPSIGVQGNNGVTLPPDASSGDYDGSKVYFELQEDVAEEYL